jgi:hypothetical protein
MGQGRAFGPGAPAATLLVGLLLAAPARADPGASCRAHRGNGRVVAEIELRDLLDEETVRLIRLGLRGRLRVEATVLRKRWLFTRQSLVTQSLERTVSAAPGGARLLVDGRTEIADPARWSLDRIPIPVEGGLPEGLSLEVEVRLQVITAASLGDVASWVTGRKKDEAGSSLERGVVAAVVDDLTRRATAVCAVEARP